MVDLGPEPGVLSAFFGLKEADDPSFNNLWIVFQHEVRLGSVADHESGCEQASCVVQVDVAASTSGGLEIYLPLQLRQPQKRCTKRRRAQKEVLLTAALNSDLVDDVLLARELRRNTLDLAVCRGPALRIEKQSGELVYSLIAAVALYRDATAKPSAMLNTSVVPKLFARALDDPTIADAQQYALSPLDLFDALTRPKQISSVKICPDGLLAQLLPFQSDTVHWCLRREGKELEKDSIVNLDPQIRDYVVTPPLGWRYVPTADLWVNPYSLAICSSGPCVEPQLTIEGEYCGSGILAEEMGLGKTLELISLIILNPRPPSSQKVVTDPLTGHKVRPVKATLVIVPSAILRQWRKELETHAPALEVLIYTGKGDRTQLTAEFEKCDLVLVSFHTVASEVHNAMFDPGKRNTRHWRDRTDINDVRSPLVRVQFWRIVLDEVQMVRTGVSNAARVARIIPRVHAWGVSGTPIKTSMNDIRGIFIFLNVQNFQTKPAWERLLASRVDFEQVLSTIGIRHTKPMVAHQLHLPPQFRYVVPLKFTSIELYFYQKRRNDLIRSEETLQCIRKRVTEQDSHSAPQDLEEKARSSKRLRFWLNELREACYLAPRSLGTGGQMRSVGVVMTVDKVLSGLVDNAETQLFNVFKTRLATQVKLGLFLDKGDHLSEALVLWADAVAEVNERVTGIQEKVTVLERERDNCSSWLEKCRADLEAADSVKRESDEDTRTIELKSQLLEGRVRDAEVSLNIASSRILAAKQRLRGLKELSHRLYFFLGTGYFRSAQRNPDSPLLEVWKVEEQKNYHLAEEVRTQLLAEAAERVTKSQELLPKVRSKPLHLSHIFPQSLYLDKQRQWLLKLLDDLRDYLKRELLEQEEDAEVEAYGETLELQDKAFVLIDVVQLLLKDRATLVFGERPPIEPVESPLEPWSKLRCQLMDMRREENLVLKQMEPVVATAHKLRREYGEQISHAITELREELQSLNKAITALSNLYNERLEYYKQLQFLSDRVVDPEVSGGDVKKVIRRTQAALNSDRKIEQEARSQLRYVSSLEIEKPQSRMESEHEHTEARICPICKDSYDLGIVTTCGHKFCNDCMSQWWDSHRSCPMCKRKLESKNLIQFRYGDAEPMNAARDLGNEIYLQIPSKTYNEILSQQMAVSYGVKIDFITMHARWLRERDPTVQIVVFSLFPGLLKSLSCALADCGVQAVFVDKVDEFRGDPGIACFLLDAKYDAAGLTLVNATHVFLCEPLFNTALELQAISRVHRIGQVQPTTVWLFNVEKTVEHAIFNISTERRVKQIAELTASQNLPTPKTEEDRIDTVDSAILAKPTGAFVNRVSGSEVVDDADIQKVLFYKFEDGDEPAKA